MRSPAFANWSPTLPRWEAVARGRHRGELNVGLADRLVIVDRQGYIFTPTALYLEAEDRLADAPNAMRLSNDQVTEALARLSPAAKVIAVALAKIDEERERIREQAIEVPSSRWPTAPSWQSSGASRKRRPFQNPAPS